MPAIKDNVFSNLAKYMGRSARKSILDEVEKVGGKHYREKFSKRMKAAKFHVTTCN